MEEGGQNLSSGQRQMICMVRALLRSVKIVLLDEATANVDMQTNNIVQQAIRKTFTDCTILLVTHRLTNVRHMNRIFYMENGKVHF